MEYGLDIIDGFCGTKCILGGPKHQCSMTLKPPIISWVSIKEVFETIEIGTICRILVANPLVTRMPCLVFCLLATCNKFTATIVEDQWTQIHNYYRTILEPRI